MTDNIFTLSPKKGDIAVRHIDTLKNLFITLDSFDNATLGGEYEVIGVVVRRRGSEVLVLYKQNASKKFCEVYEFKLTGYTLDGTERSGVFSVRENSDSWAANRDYTFNYNSSTIDGFVSQLNEYFSANEPFNGQGWKAFLIDGEVRLQFTFSAWQQAPYNTAKSGLSMSANLLPEWGALSSVRRKSGYVGGEGAISCFERALAYFKNDNRSNNYNPSEEVTSVERNFPICLPGYLGISQYQSDHCAYLRGVYGEGEDGWRLFMRSCLPVKRTDYGNFAMKNGGEVTNMLAKTRAYSGGVMFSAAEYAHSISSPTISEGEFHLPTIEELTEITEDLKYGTEPSRNADMINAGLQKIGGSPVSNDSYAWSCCRGSSYSVFDSYGGSGFFSNNSMYYSYLALPVTLLKCEA